MPFRKLPSPVLDGDTVDEMPEDPDREAADPLALAEEAEAEAAEAEALAAAARARAKALRLRREAEEAEAAKAGSAPEPEASDDDNDDSAVDESDDAAEEPAVKRRRLRLPRPSRKLVAASVAVIGICALLAASGYMTWYHRQVQADQQRTAEFAAAARQGVVTLMTLDFNHAEENVQRIIDSSTGQFKQDFESTATDFIDVAKESKAVTETTVSTTAVESMTDDTATVIVAATSRVSNAAGANREPRAWRLSVNLARDGGQIKMAKVEFVP